jgi:dihydrofolate reductase
VRTQYYCAASLDGYIADADDSLDWLTGYEATFAGPADEAGPMVPGGSYERFYAGVGALVSGSVTYEWLLAHAEPWPYPGKPYWVMTTRDLPRPAASDADVRFFDGGAAELHARIAEEAGEAGNLWIVGGGGVASQFTAAGRLDDVLLTVVPVLLGAGKPVFDRPLPGPLRLTGTTAFANGMVELRYDAAPA